MFPGEVPPSRLRSSELEKDHVFRVYDSIAVHWNHTRGRRKVLLSPSITLFRIWENCCQLLLLLYWYTLKGRFICCKDWMNSRMNEFPFKRDVIIIFTPYCIICDMRGEIYVMKSSIGPLASREVVLGRSAPGITCGRYRQRRWQVLQC